MKNLAQIFTKIEDYILESSEIIKIDVYKDMRKINIIAKFSEFISLESLENLENRLCMEYKLKSISIEPKYDKSLFNADLIGEIAQFIAIQKPIVRTLLSGAKAALEGENLIIEIATIGAEQLKSNECDECIADYINQHFSIKLNVVFREQKSQDKLLEEFENNKDEIIKQAEETAKLNMANKQVNEVIFGKQIKGTPTKIAEITELSGNVVVEGELFAKEIDVRETRDGKFIVKFDITDNESSITCKILRMERNAYTSIKERLSCGTRVRVKGIAQFDMYSREVVLMANDINETPKEMRMDCAEEKRVELHLHTQMSTMDSMVDIPKLMQRAHQWGHKAIAITDHGVAQAFPFAMDKIPKKSDLKILYGVEIYLVDIGRPIAFNYKGQDLLKNIVVFDIETTGFSSQNDRITEIGAVKIQNGELTDRFSTFINPEIPIPEKITKLTGITDQMVSESENITQILPKFLDFCGDAVLVAHNAKFDMGFIKENAQRLEIKDYNPAYIDTVELARGILPELQNHKLNTVAQNLGISLEGHHRAVNDAEATALIYLNFANSLAEQGVNSIDDVNDAFDEEKNVKDKHYSHAVIFAKNYTGLKNLYKIISASHLEHFYKKPRVSKSLYFKNNEGLIIGSACEQGELYRAFLKNKPQEEISRLARFYDYYEIQPLANNEFMVRKGTVESKQNLIDINKKIVELGNYYKKPVVATCDVHFLDPEDSIYRAVLQAGLGYTDSDMQAPLYLRTTEEMLEEFAYLGKEKAYEVVVTNTNKIADMCEKMLPVPNGTFPPVWENAPTEIKEMSIAKAKRIYGENLPEVVQARMDKELNSIIKYGFSVMYLIAQRLVTKSNADGYLVGSRGSVGSSFIAFLSDITEVNALPPHYVCEKCKHSEFITDGSALCGADMEDKNCPVCGESLLKDGHDIPFETFLGFEGDKEPDIDLNFSGDYQPNAHKYTEELFGEGHVFRAGTIGTLADKTAYGFVKKYLDERSKTVPQAEISRLVNGCCGVKRTTGQHPGGVMILPKGHDIHEFCPIQRPADDDTKNIITTHFDYHSISGRLLKLDILGHDDPTMIKMLEDLTGVNAKTIPLDDAETMSLFTSTKALGITPDDIGSDVGTFGVPEFGTKFVRQMLVDTKPTTFAELVRISGLSHGTNVWLNNAQDLVRSGIAKLKEVICTRDDIMVYLIYSGMPAKTAFDIMERVRKGKGLTEDDVYVMKENNVPQWYIESCNKIQYMFPKAHAVAYVTMAFRIAWFKVHYPEAFYLAHFTVRADEFDVEFMSDHQKAKQRRAQLESIGKDANAKEKNVLSILEIVCEMFARGIKFLPIDLYKSHSSEFLSTGNGILPPLNALAGLGTNAAVSVVTEREIEKFSSVDDLRVRTKISKTVIELLRSHGCLDGMPESSQITFF